MTYNYTKIELNALCDVNNMTVLELESEVKEFISYRDNVIVTDLQSLKIDYTFKCLRVEYLYKVVK